MHTHKVYTCWHIKIYAQSPAHIITRITERCKLGTVFGHTFLLCVFSFCGVWISAERLLGWSWVWNSTLGGNDICSFCQLCAFMYVCMHVCMWCSWWQWYLLFLPTVCIYVCMYVCLYACMHVCAYVHMHVKSWMIDMHACIILCMLLDVVQLESCIVLASYALSIMCFWDACIILCMLLDVVRMESCIALANHALSIMCLYASIRKISQTIRIINA
jgi:hypothetical protein